MEQRWTPPPPTKTTTSAYTPSPPPQLFFLPTPDRTSNILFLSPLNFRPIVFPIPQTSSDTAFSLPWSNKPDINLKCLWRIHLISYNKKSRTSCAFFNTRWCQTCLRCLTSTNSNIQYVKFVMKAIVY